MNPNIDLTSFTRTGQQVAVLNAPSAQLLVSPPRRLITRYIVPAILMGGFAALAVYAGRGVWQRPVAVAVISPTILGVASGLQSAAMQSPMQTSAAMTTTSAQLTNKPLPTMASPLFQAPAWIEPSPLPITITALTTGNVRNVHVLEGQTVTSGTLVAELFDEEHALDEKEAEANLALKNAQLEAAQSDWENPTALTEALNTAKAEAVRLQAEKAGAQTQLELATKEAQAGRSLLKGGYEADLTTFKQQADERTQKSTIAEIDAKIVLNQVALKAAEERMRLRVADKERLATAQADVRNAEVALAQARLKHERCDIKAPSDGVIMQLFVRPGSMIGTAVEGGMQVATMYDPMNVQARAEIPLAETSKIQVGLQAEIRVDAVPDHVYHGELVRVVPQADVQKNVLPVKVRITDPDGELRPDMIAKVQFLKTAPRKSAKAAPSKVGQAPAVAQTASAGAALLALPESVLVDVQPGSASIWTATAAGNAQRRVIKIGEKRGELREVLDGLQPPDRVIASQLDQLKPGSKIHITEEK